MKEPDETGTYAGDGGLSLFFQAWHPAGVPRGALINLHGLGDHGGLYPRVVEHFTAAGWAVYAPDLRGNGRSSGQRGYVERWQELRNDLRAFVALVRRGGIDRPPVVQGNSLGGLIALDYALHEPASISGVVAIAPPLGALGVRPLVLLLGRLLSQVWPRFSLEVGMDLSNLSRDPAVVALLLGLDGARYLHFRTSVRAARHREPITMKDAFEGFTFALEARRARELLRRF